ncbi:hypothetical protein Tco_0323383 [Tanacetum coccineum]
MQSSSPDSSNDILKSISSLLRELTVGSHESADSNVNMSLKTIAGNSVSTDSRKQNNRCGKEEETLATITTDMKPTLNDDKPGEYYYEMEAKEQKQWKLESEREARLEATRKQREEHWKELEAIQNLEEEYEEDHELEEEDKDNEYESFDYNDLH